MQCCAEVRAYLDCSPLPSVPCRGFAGDCADIPLQYADVPGSGLEFYRCRQFPNPVRPFAPTRLTPVVHNPLFGASFSRLAILNRPRIHFSCLLPQEFVRHRIIAGLLMLAVALPTKQAIQRLFELSNGSCPHTAASPIVICHEHSAAPPTVFQGVCCLL